MTHYTLTLNYLVPTKMLDTQRVNVVNYLEFIFFNALFMKHNK